MYLLHEIPTTSSQPQLTGKALILHSSSSSSSPSQFALQRKGGGKGEGLQETIHKYTCGYCNIIKSSYYSYTCEGTHTSYDITGPCCL